MSLLTVQRTLLHKPNRIASVASLAFPTTEEIFPTTQGEVHIDFISFNPLTTNIPATDPVVVTLGRPGTLVVYMTLVCAGFKTPPIIPGFVLPAGGLEASSNSIVPVSIDVFYETHD